MKSIQIKLLYGLIVAVLLFEFPSCKSEEDKRQQYREDMRQKISLERAKIISELEKNYLLQHRLDTLFFKYSVQYQDIVNTLLLIPHPKIHDIYEEDSVVYLSASLGTRPPISSLIDRRAFSSKTLFELKLCVTEDVDDVLKSVMEYDSDSKKAFMYMVVKLDKIDRLKTNTIERSDEFRNYQRTFHCAGKLVDIKLKEVNLYEED